jgi:deazaflavin-dependent oxidoreductase (nitroreductase family)
MTDEWNVRVIREFRANGGKVGGQFQDAPMLLLTTTGRRSGKPRTTPLMYLADGDRWLVFASNAGGAKHPDWYFNILADPHVIVEVDRETVKATARVVDGAERDRYYTEQARRQPGFAEYERQTTRVIPVVALERAGDKFHA